MKLIVALVLVLLGIGGGGALGVYLKPEVERAEGDAGDPATAPQSAERTGPEEDGPPAGREYVKIGRQTIIPVVEGRETKALMMFELAVDVPAGRSPDVHEVEPRLRDAFLRELFKMSHTGAFMTTFTDDRIIEELRQNLVQAARLYLGPDVDDVLILDVMRQEF